MTGAGRARRLGWAWLAILLAGCAGVTERDYRLDRQGLDRALAFAPVCCASLARLPWREAPLGGTERFALHPGSPAFVFASGKSFFRAWRLPAPAGGLTLQIRSDPVETGDGDILLFAPALLLLDRDYRQLRLLETGLVRPVQDGKVTRLEGEVSIEDEDAAWLVLLTTDRLLQGKAGAGHAPVGYLAVRWGPSP